MCLVFFAISHVFFAVWGKNENKSVFFAEKCHIYEIPGTACVQMPFTECFLGV